MIRSFIILQSFLLALSACDGSQHSKKNPKAKKQIAEQSINLDEDAIDQNAPNDIEQSPHEVNPADMDLPADDPSDKSEHDDEIEVDME